MSNKLFFLSKLGYFQVCIIIEPDMRSLQRLHYQKPLMSIKRVVRLHPHSSQLPVICKLPTSPFLCHNLCFTNFHLLIRLKKQQQKQPLSTKSHDPWPSHCLGIFACQGLQQVRVPEATVSASNEHTCNRVMPLAAWLLLMELSWRSLQAHQQAEVSYGELEALLQQMVTLQ